MEKNKRSHLGYLLLLLPFWFLLAESNCVLLPENLSCYNDFNATINCVWNSTYEHQDDVCTVEASRKTRVYTYYNSCTLQSEDLSRPLQRRCKLLYKLYRFVEGKMWLINISCSTKGQVLSIEYLPHCHIKLNPPPKPVVNLTTVVWFPQSSSHVRIQDFFSQLQLRQQGQPWGGPPLCKEGGPTLCKECKWKQEKDTICKIRLPDDLIKGEKYEARIRVQSTKYQSTWSDWSPSESWVATVGREKPTPALPSDAVTITVGTLVGLVMFVLAIIFVKTDRTKWIYIVKRLRGPPLPHPGKSFLQDVDFKNPKNPPFSSESLLLLVKPVEIVQVEVTSCLSAVRLTNLEEKLPAMLPVKDGRAPASSSFCNPIYSNLAPPLPPALPLAALNPQTCDTHTPHGSRSCHRDKQDEELAIMRLLSEGSSEAVVVISDYEKVDRAETDRVRLRSSDSGMCSAEEVSQESLEADSITKSGDETEEEENDFLKIFGGKGILDQGSIQVCSGYEQIPKKPSNTSELLRLDSGISSDCGQLANHQDRVTEEEDEQQPAKLMILHSPPAPESRFSSSTLPASPLNRPGADFAGAGEILRTALTSSDRVVSEIEPSADEYLPVRWGLKTEAVSVNKCV